MGMGDAEVGLFDNKIASRHNVDIYDTVGVRAVGTAVGTFRDGSLSRLYNIQHLLGERSDITLTPMFLKACGDSKPHGSEVAAFDVSNQPKVFSSSRNARLMLSSLHPRLLPMFR